MGDPTGPAAQFEPMPSSIYLYVNDCDSVYQRAIQAGGESVMEVTDIPFNGERYGGAKDPTGNVRPMTRILMVIKPDERYVRERG